MRIGFGYDVHPLTENRDLILGGVNIPFELGLSGHSDADALAHAIIDAMFGALALGTIGEFFPDTDPAYKDCCSMKLLSEANSVIREKGASIVNIDCTIVAQKPKLLSYLPQMRENIAHRLEVEVNQVSVKAKKEEGLGFTGNLTGIKAYAVALLDQGGN